MMQPDLSGVCSRKRLIRWATWRWTIVRGSYECVCHQGWRRGLFTNYLGQSCLLVCFLAQLQRRLCLVLINFNSIVDINGDICQKQHYYLHRCCCKMSSPLWNTTTRPEKKQQLACDGITRMPPLYETWTRKLADQLRRRINSRELCLHTARYSGNSTRSAYSTLFRISSSNTMLSLGPFHGAIAVSSVTRCRCCCRRRRCCGHRCAGGVRQWRRPTVATPGEWQCGVRRLAVANGPIMFT